MQKPLYFLLSLMAALPSLAQQRGETLQKNFLVKFAPAAIATGKISLGGEYYFDQRKSFTFYAGIPVSKSHTLSYDGDKSDVQVKSLSVMAGYRYYLSGRNTSGLYLEPYLKYTDHHGEGVLNGSLGTKTTRLDSREFYSGFGLGAQFGVQFMIGNRIAIDWFLLGPEISLASFDSRFQDITSSDWSQQDAVEIEADIRDVLDDIPMVGKKIDLEVNAAQKTVTGKYRGLIPGIRTGISLGIRL